VTSMSRSRQPRSRKRAFTCEFTDEPIRARNKMVRACLPCRQSRDDLLPYIVFSHGLISRGRSRGFREITRLVRLGRPAAREN